LIHFYKRCRSLSRRSDLVEQKISTKAATDIISEKTTLVIALSEY